MAEDLGDSLRQMGKVYQIAILVGPSEEFSGMNEGTWMSGRVYVRLDSQDSIYYRPYLFEDGKADDHKHSHGGN